MLGLAKSRKAGRKLIWVLVASLLLGMVGCDSSLKTEKPVTKEPVEERELGMVTLRQAIEIGKEELKRINYSWWNRELIVKADDNNTAWNNHIRSLIPDKKDRRIRIGRASPSGSETVIIDPKGKEYWAVYYVPKKGTPKGGDGFVFIDRSNGKVIGVILGE